MDNDEAKIIILREEVDTIKKELKLLEFIRKDIEVSCSTVLFLHILPCVRNKCASQFIIIVTAFQFYYHLNCFVNL